MSKMDLRDNLYRCTSNSMWVCMIEGRFLVSKKGKVGWTSKSTAARAFVESDYWRCMVDILKSENPDITDDRWRFWKDRKKGKELEDKEYQELLENGIVKYIEITPVPEWANI